MKLKKSFYLTEDVVALAKSLLGKYIYTNIDNKGITSGIITETEAYAGVIDKASHAFGNRRTTRTEIMYLEGGVAYVYLCYGIHSLFNIVTNKKDIPHAVLIRGIKPVDGIPIMLERCKKKSITDKSGIGPGNVTKLLGIHYSHTGLSLQGNDIWLEDKNIKIQEKNIIVGTRVGVDYAGEDAKLPYRFQIKL
ncbi:MAG TPA: DNA-3-methyladenine glycosylase [Bacteroidales bacterium]|nr:DNA-3-methyladenine glycosylase [Bacteroidales bacterium]HPS16544.1 DNA-3-methyladenine glycosylase [Bacteroidales bacterium]